MVAVDREMNMRENKSAASCFEVLTVVMIALGFFFARPGLHGLRERMGLNPDFPSILQVRRNLSM